MTHVEGNRGKSSELQPIRRQTIQEMIDASKRNAILSETGAVGEALFLGDTTAVFWQDSQQNKGWITIRVKAPGNDASTVSSTITNAQFGVDMGSDEYIPMIGYTDPSRIVGGILRNGTVYQNGRLPELTDEELVQRKGEAGNTAPQNTQPILDAEVITEETALPEEVPGEIVEVSEAEVDVVAQGELSQVVARPVIGAGRRRGLLGWTIGPQLDPRHPLDEPGIFAKIHRNIQSRAENDVKMLSIAKGFEPGEHDGWTTRKQDLKELMVPYHPASLERVNRLYLGKFGGEDLAAPDGISVTLTGAPGKRKTVTLKNMLEHWLNPALALSSKPDFLDTIHIRELYGNVDIFAPFGFGEKSAELEKGLGSRIKPWSPLDYCKNWERTMRMAHWTTKASQKGAREDGSDRFFTIEGERTISVLLGGVRMAGGDMEQVVEIADELDVGSSNTKFARGVRRLEDMYRELAPKIPESEKKYAQMAVQRLDAFKNMSERTRSSVAGMVQTIVHTYSNPRILEATKTQGREAINLEALPQGMDTVFLVGTSDEQRDFSSIYEAMVEEASRAVRQYQRYDPRTFRHMPPEHYTCVFNDEATNGPVFDFLLQDVTEGRALGLVYANAFQFGTEFERRYGEGSMDTLVGATIFECFKGTDARTVDSINKRAGTAERATMHVARQARMKDVLKGKEGKKKSEVTITEVRYSDTGKPIKNNVPKININHTNNLKDGQVVIANMGSQLLMGDAIAYYEDPWMKQLAAKALGEEKTHGVIKAFAQRIFPIANGRSLEEGKGTQAKELPAGDEGNQLKIES